MTVTKSETYSIESWGFNTSKTSNITGHGFLKTTLFHDINRTCPNLNTAKVNRISTVEPINTCQRYLSQFEEIFVGSADRVNETIDFSGEIYSHAYPVNQGYLRVMYVDNKCTKPVYPLQYVDGMGVCAKDHTGTLVRQVNSNGTVAGSISFPSDNSSSTETSSSTLLGPSVVAVIVAVAACFA